MKGIPKIRSIEWQGRSEVETRINVGMYVRGEKQFCIANNHASHPDAQCERMFDEERRLVCCGANTVKRACVQTPLG